MFDEAGKVIGVVVAIAVVIGVVVFAVVQSKKRISDTDTKAGKTINASFDKTEELLKGL